jgi:hypothetical protein
MTFGGQRDLIVTFFSDCETDAAGQVCLASKRAIIFRRPLDRRVNQSQRTAQNEAASVVDRSGENNLHITPLCFRYGEGRKSDPRRIVWTASSHPIPVLRYCVLETGLLAALPDVQYFIRTQSSCQISASILQKKSQLSGTKYTRPHVSRCQ